MVGTHAFIPRHFKLGDVPTCQCCPCTAAHPVHDWLSVKDYDNEKTFAGKYLNDVYPELKPMTPKEMVQLPNLFTADEWAERDAQQPDSSQQPVEEGL